MIKHSFSPKMCCKNFDNRLTNKNSMSKNVFEQGLCMAYEIIQRSLTLDSGKFVNIIQTFGPLVSFSYNLGHVKRIWYLSPMWAAKVQASLRIRAVSPEPPLLAHTSSESRGTFRQKARSLAPLNDWACAVKICHDGMLEDTNSLDAAHLVLVLWVFKNFLEILFFSGKIVTSLANNFSMQNPYSNTFLDVNFLFVNRYSKYLRHILGLKEC